MSCNCPFVKGEGGVSLKRQTLNLHLQNKFFEYLPNTQVCANFLALKRVGKANHFKEKMKERVRERETEKKILKE